MPKCQNCENTFPNRIEVDGKVLNLTSRRFCLDCSPLGENNRRKYITTLEPGKAFCVRCQQQKDRNMFHNRKGGLKPLSYCQECSEEVKLLKAKERIEKAVALRGGLCADCGNTFPTMVFEFVKDGKAIRLSIAKHMSWERFKERLEGCEMLCRNCSAIRQWEQENA